MKRLILTNVSEEELTSLVGFTLNSVTTDSKSDATIMEYVKTIDNVTGGGDVVIGCRVEISADREIYMSQEYVVDILPKEQE